MGTFTKAVPFEIDYAGDHITMKLERFTRGDMLTLNPHMSKKEGKTGMAFGDVLEMMNVCGPVLLNRIKEFEGCKDGNGNKLSLEDVLEENYFVNLFTAIMRECMEISFLKDDDVKKLDVPLGTLSTSNEDIEQTPPAAA